MIHDGDYIGEIKDNKPDGFGRLSISDVNDDGNGYTLKLVGEWSGGVLHGYGALVEYAHYEHIERGVSIYLGQWRGGDKEGFGVRGTCSMTWDLENLPWLNVGLWSKSKQILPLIRYMPSNKNDVYNCDNLQKFVVALDKNNILIAQTHNCDISNVHKWERNLHIFSGLGNRGI